MSQRVAVEVAPARVGWRAVSSSQWLVLVSAFLGWLFDSMDFTVLNLVVFPSLVQLLHTTKLTVIGPATGLISAVKLFTWGIGGILFGVMADRIGRSRTMVVTISLYGLFTGLSALAQTWWQLMILQAVSGLGIGGEWAAGAALIAETWPGALRTKAMQIMQLAFSAGYFLAAVINLTLAPLSWRWVFAAGIIPLPIILLVRRYVREPELWRKTRFDRLAAAEPDPGAVRTFTAIFAPGLLGLTVVGTLISVSMMLAGPGTGPWLASWVNQLVGPGHARSAAAAVSYTVT